MKCTRTVSARGFTLIEVVMVMAIIGVLATVAIPGFRLMNYRAKAAERGMAVRAIRNALEGVRLKDGTFGAGVTGNWNPALPLSIVKRTFVNMAPGWSQLDLVVDGNMFYSYMFTAQEPGGAVALPQFSIFVQGDIDADGDVYAVSYTYQQQPGGWVQTSPDIPALYDYTVF